MMFIFLIAIACVLQVEEIYASRGPRWGPFPICDSCIPAEMLSAPGIGFDLTTTYGTAAITYANGTVVLVEGTEGSKGYQSMMKRFTAESSRPEYPPKNGFQEAWRRFKRNLNKRLGRPATADVGTIARIIKQLRVNTENVLRQDVSNVVISRPMLPGFSEEDLADALEYVGIRSQKQYSYWGDVSETSAAFAAAGYGLCKNYTRLRECEMEEPTFPHHHILAVSYTRQTLSITLTWLQDALESREIIAVVNWDLGSNVLQWRSPNLYWAEVHQAIRDVAVRSTYPLTVLLIMGEDASNEAFLDVVREVVGEFQGYPWLSPHDAMSMAQAPKKKDFLYHVAKGSSLFAKRWQATPWDCIEPSRCQEARKDRVDYEVEL